MQIKNFRENDLLIMKKNHACKKSATRFKVIRIGSDVRMVCCDERTKAAYQKALDDKEVDA